MVTPRLKLPLASASVKGHPELKLPGVYAIVHKRSGRIYIGSTSRAAGVVTRLNEHRSKLRSGRHPSRRLQHAFVKYGIEAFEWWLVESCQAEDAKRLEQTYLDLTRARTYNTLRKATEYRPYSLAARAAIAEHASKPFALEYDGEIHAGKNLTAFCRAQGLHQGAMTQVLLGKKPQFKGWTLPGKGLPPTYIRNATTGEIACIPHLGGRPFARARGISLSRFNLLLRGAIPSCGGWILTGKPRRRRIDQLRHVQ